MFKTIRRGFCVFALLVVLSTTLIFPTSAFSNSPSSTLRQGSHLSDCIPGAGLKWTTGPKDAAFAAQVQSVFEEHGLPVVVAATRFGETDSCGTFQPIGFDLNISIASQAFPSQEEVAHLLQSFAGVRFGNVEIAQSDGKYIKMDGAALQGGAGAYALQTAAAGWTAISTAASPSSRYIHGMAFDSARNVTVLFGGDHTGSSRLNDTWEYNGSNWTQVITPQSPPGRVSIDQTMVFDSGRNRTVIFGGLGSSGYLSDTWEYNGLTWTLVTTNPTPPARDAHAMVYDSSRGKTVLFGGYVIGGPSNDTWEYNGSWQKIEPAQKPPLRLHHSMVYDTRRQKVILFGGIGGSNQRLNDMWEYDGTNWVQITPAALPGARENHSMAYDGNTGSIVLFGGWSGSSALNDTWEFDGTTWTQISTSSQPSVRTEMMLVYDSYRKKTVMFGGGYWAGGLNVFNDTWEYVSSALPIVNIPNKKKVYVIVYDPLLSNNQNLSTYMHWNSHTQITQQVLDFFKQASHNQLEYSVVDTKVVTDGWPEKADGYIYTEAAYLAAVSGQQPYHTPDRVNYNKIVNDPRFDICGRVNRREIDEVWIYNGPGFGFWESTLVGPNAYFLNSSPVSGPNTCSRLIPIMGPSLERTVTESVENFGHRTESTMRQAYHGWSQNQTTHNWERFALVKFQSPNYSYSGCGSVHYPPNGVRDYDYTNTSTVNTNCDDFINYPTLHDPLTVLKSVTCSTWGCSHFGYFNWWFSHIPWNVGCAPDGLANNWWQYIANPDFANQTRKGCYPYQAFASYVSR